MKPISGSLKTLISICVATTVLSGCVAAALGGAAVGGNTIADRRSTGAISDDAVMEVRVHNQAKSGLKRRYAQAGVVGIDPELSIISYDRRILLLGQVVSEADRAYVESVARQESNARAVFNHIQVTNAKRTLSNISSDTMITSKLRTRLLNVQGVYAGHVKVVTFNSVVYVMGILTPAQQAAVTEVVSTTPGVMQVVTLYENYSYEPTQTN